MRLTAEFGNDVRFQFRHGFYYAYLLVSSLYILFLRNLPEDLQQTVGTMVLFSDPGVLGFFFVGGIVLLERGQSILDNLFVTSLRMWEYLIAKVASLTVLAVTTSFVVVIATFGWTFNPLLLFTGIALSSAFFTLFGLGLAVRMKTLNGYLLISPLFVPIFFLPVLENFDLFSTPLFYLLPGKSTLLLIQGAFDGVTAWQALYALGTMAVWIGLAYRWAHHSFYQYVVLKIGGGQG